MRNKTAKQKRAYGPYRTPKFSAYDEETVLFRKLIKSVLGIIIVLLLTVTLLNFLGPKIFSVLGFLSIDKWTKNDGQKTKTYPPTFVDHPEAVKEKNFSVSGYSEPGSLVRIFVNGPEVVSTTADDDGEFVSEKFELLEGQNIIFAKASSKDKEESDKSNTIYVIFDEKKPEISINEPKNGATVESVDSRVNVKGVVNEKASILVNNHNSIVDNEGNFQSLVSLKSGNNVITVTARDKAGNESTKSINVEFKKR